MSIFEQASRKKLRFIAHAGGPLWTAEDLWDLPLQATHGRPSLDGIALPLFRTLQDSAPVSFVDTTAATSEQDDVKLRFDIVKHIIDVRKAERAAAQETQARRQQDQRILAILADKEEGALRDMTPEQLRARLSGAVGTEDPMAETKAA